MDIRHGFDGLSIILVILVTWVAWNLIINSFHWVFLFKIRNNFFTWLFEISNSHRHQGTLKEFGIDQWYNIGFNVAVHNFFHFKLSICNVKEKSSSI